LSFDVEVDLSKMIFVYLIIGIIVSVYLWFSKRLRIWEERGFLSPPTSIPFGNLKGIGTKITNFEALDVFYKQFKGKAPAIGLYFFASPTIMAIDLDLIKNILIRDFSSFHDRGFYYNKV
jgi:cytochrome P450 family 6